MKYTASPISPGDRFGFLTAVRRSESPHVGRNGSPNADYWICLCDCGSERAILGTHLRTGGTVSCGCYRKKMKGEWGRTHGGSGTGEFRCWSSMLTRCYNPNFIGWRLYGGRGIVVCDRWRYSFENFRADMGPRPTPKHSIDRYPNPDGNYEPGNCRWATQTEQGRNRKTCRFLIFRGESKTLAEWVDQTGLPGSTITNRLRRGWSVEDALTAPADVGTRKDDPRWRHITIGGETRILEEWMRHLGVNRNTVKWRLRNGWDVVSALTTPSSRRRG